MTIEMLDQGTILVSLGADDMRLYALRFEEEHTCEAGLKSLLYRVGEVCGLDHRGKSYLIEALPSSQGCLLIISVHPVKRRRRYRIKRRVMREVCVFFDADAMLDCLRSGCCMSGCGIYLYEGQYVLLPSPAAPQSALAKLSEYGELRCVSPTVVARVREHGSLLLLQEAQRRHIGGRAVAVRDAAAGDRGG